MTESQLPKFLSADHIKTILQISYSEASDFLDSNIIPVFVIGNTRRVLAKDFNRWLYSYKGNKWVT